MPTLDVHIPELDSMRSYPDKLFYKGDTALLSRPKVSIVGSRRPSQYTQQVTYQIAAALAKRGVCVVSGAAMGVDAIAHRGAGAANTIAVLPSGIEVRYPSVNKALIASIEEEGLTLSQFEPDFRQAPWSFVVRNETVVALGEVLVVTQADLSSGSMRSVEFAQAMGKSVYVIPHRLGESKGTNKLLATGKAEVIHDIHAFAEGFTDGSSIGTTDPLLRFCRDNPRYEDVVERFGEAFYTYELEGKVAVVAGRVIIT